MNKPANLAIIAFIILGALMWFAASGSLDQYIATYQQTIKAKLPAGSEFSLGKVKLSASQSSGELTNLDLSVPTKTTANMQLKAANINWQYQKKSLKKSVVILDSVHFNQIEIRLPKDDSINAIAESKNYLIKIIEQALASGTGLNGNNEFLVSINNLTIANLYITQMQGDIPHQEVIVSNISVTPSTLAKEHAMSVSATHVILSVLDLAEQKLQSM